MRFLHSAHGRYGPRTTVYNRYARWAQRGVWRDTFEALAQNGEGSLLFIDASIVKAHRAATGATGGLAQDIGRLSPVDRCMTAKPFPPCLSQA